MNKTTFHTENDHTMLTLRCCADCGVEASFEDMRNLKSNQKMGEWAVGVQGGFKIIDSGLAYIHSWY